MISEALTGQEASVGPPWFDRYTVPLALILVLLSGIGPVIAWRRATLANARRNFVVPIAVALATLVVLLAADVPVKPFALAMFCCAAFVFGSIGQEFFRGMRARSAIAGEAPPLALVALVRRNRRRYGGYIVHIGIAVLFVGVAGSTSFQHESELGLSPGQSSRVGAYTLKYVRPTASVTPDYDSASTQSGRELSAIIRAEPGVRLGPDTARTGATLSLGAVIDVSKHGRHVTTLYPSEGFYASEEPAQGSVGHLIGGQPVSHVAVDAGVTRDVWTAIAPNIETPQLKRIVTLGNQTLPYIHPGEGMVAIAALAAAYMKSPPQAQFHLIVSPLVMWIWIGGLIVVGGSLIAIWPAPALSAAARPPARAMIAPSAVWRAPEPCAFLTAAIGVEFLIAIVALALLVVVILVISAPLRAGRRPQDVKPEEARAELEAAREAKYREIRDAELDYSTGKLSQEDFAATDGALRAEAVEILDWLDALDGPE